MLVSFVLFVRVTVWGGFAVVNYVLAIYLLNLFIGFLTPALGDLEDEENDVPVLPVNDSDEFKPFIRKVPEFQFWWNFTVGVIVGLTCTFFDAFNVPVYWPILVIYFVFLLIFTLRRQIAHMAKHSYIPINIGKPNFTAAPE
jgi:hypothetical protein